MGLRERDLPVDRRSFRGFVAEIAAGLLLWSQIPRDERHLVCELGTSNLDEPHQPPSHHRISINIEKYLWEILGRLAHGDHATVDQVERRVVARARTECFQVMLVLADRATHVFAYLRERDDVVVRTDSTNNGFTHLDKNARYLGPVRPVTSIAVAILLGIIVIAFLVKLLAGGLTP